MYVCVLFLLDAWRDTWLWHPQKRYEGWRKRKKWWWWDTFTPCARWRRDRKSPNLHFQVKSQLLLKIYHIVFFLCIFLSPSSLIPRTTTTLQPLILHFHPPEAKDTTKSSGILFVHISVSLEFSYLVYLYQELKSKIWKLIVIIELKMCLDRRRFPWS